MKKFLTLLAALALSAGSAFASGGIFGGYAGISANGAPIAWYNLVNLGNPGAGAFQGVNFGTFDITIGQTLSLSGAEGLIFKNNGTDVTGVAFNYRIYPTGSPTGAFTTAARDFSNDAPFADAAGNNFTNGGDQKWANNPVGTLPADLLQGLSAGNYTLEVFFSGTTNSVDSPANLFLNNGGANYTASFTVIPEPSTYALVAFGSLAAGFVSFRRRKA